MPSSCKSQIIALLATSILLGISPTSFQSLKAQTTTSKSQASVPTPEVAKQKPDYSQETVIVEQLSMVYRFERNGTGQRELSFRAKVQSDAAVERFGQLVFDYSSANEKLDMDFVRVRKADGTVVNAAASDIQDLTAPVAREAPVYTDLREKHITVPGLRPGDLLEYHMVWNVHTALAPSHFWVEHSFVTTGTIVLNDELTIDIPGASKVKLKTEPGFEPTIKKDNDRCIYHWKHANLKPGNDEEEKNKEEEGKEESEELRPHVQLTTFQSWDEVGQWYADLQRDRIVPDEKIKVKAEEIISGRITDKEKVKALYEYVARNFRYVSVSLGQGRYQPHTAASVMTNQYGDCKDKHTLLASMLAATGLRAYPVLLNTERKIDVDVPSPGQFDHVISASPLGAETLWVDTTAEIAPAGLLSPNLRDKKALMIPTTGPALLETTPAEPPFLFSEIVTVEGAVDDFGKLTAHARMVFRGDAEMEMRFAFRRIPRNNWKSIGPYLGMAVGIEGEVTDIKTTDPADSEKPFEVEFNVLRNAFLDWSSKKLRVALPFPPLKLSRFKDRGAASTKPLELGPPIEISYTLQLTLPGKYQARLPLPLKVSRDYGEYAANYKLQGPVLVGERKLRLRQREIPAERLQDYQAFAGAVSSDEAQTISLETEIVRTVAIPDSVKTEDLMQAAIAAGKNRNFAVAEQLLRRVVEKDPQHKTVRRYLGVALAEQRKFATAVEVLLEQTKINPFEDFTYSVLGEIYWQQQDYANAEAAFRKQIEVTPLDQHAHADLGQMLVEWRKYKEAIPELERAISLTPEQEMLHVSLGCAYLNLGDTQKSIAAFEEAVELDRSPRILNNIAYFLADKGAQLDKALQYSESAVTSTAVTLRNLEIDNLRIDDLQNVAALAAYWNTLGWIYFQKGDIDSAEKYIKAAWALRQHGEVGHHLGMIAEKRGKKEEAIRLYAQGVAAFNPVPEARAGLVRLASPNSIETLLETARQDLREYNTFALGQLVRNLNTVVEAEFYVVFAPDSARSSQVIDVKFIKGAESLKSLGPALKTIKYQLIFPDNSPTKVIRRGALLCLPKPGACTFTMVSPNLITSVD
jgi:tetratricopeptide (TPR) repeat protein